MTNETEKIGRLEVEHKSGKTLNLELHKFIKHNNAKLYFVLFGATVIPTIKKGNKYLRMSSDSLKGETKKQLETLFNTKINCKDDLYLVLTDKSYAEIEEAKSTFELEVQDCKNDYSKRAEQMPQWFEMYDCLNMSDYAFDHEREIRIYRNPLSEDNHDKVLVFTYKLWNLKDETLENEWNEDFANVGGLAENNSVVVPNELAQKWIAKHSEILQAKEVKENEEQRMVEEKIAEEKQRRLNCFLEAKQTNKKVVLYSSFLSDNEIPREYRDADSDMGHLITYAMPDGTTKEEFINAY